MVDRWQTGSVAPVDRSWRELILADGRALLSRIRAGAASDDEVQLVSGVDVEGRVADQHLAARAGLLWALQYDHEPTDDDLLRRLLAAESVWSAVRPFQGLSDELRLAAFLVASHPREGDVELMWAAKRSNFDAWCGFDGRFLGCRGVGDMLAVATSGAAEVDGLLDVVTSESGEVFFTDGEVAEFIGSLVEEFPASPDGEWPSTWVRRGLFLGRSDLASAALDDWIGSDEPPTARTRSRLLADCARFSEAAVVQRSIVEDGVRSDRSYLDLVRLVELHRRAGELDQGVDAFGRVLVALSELADRNGYKHRVVCEEGFALSRAIPDREIAGEVFRAAHDVAMVPFPNRNLDRDSTEYLPLVVLRAAAEAAEHVGEHETSSSYRVRADLEAARIVQPPPGERVGRG